MISRLLLVPRARVGRWERCCAALLIRRIIPPFGKLVGWRLHHFYGGKRVKTPSGGVINVDSLLYTEEPLRPINCAGFMSASLTGLGRFYLRGFYYCPPPADGRMDFFESHAIFVFARVVKLFNGNFISCIGYKYFYLPGKD